jgi:hypothetical protein
MVDSGAGISANAGSCQPTLSLAEDWPEASPASALSNTCEVLHIKIQTEFDILAIGALQKVDGFCGWGCIICLRDEKIVAMSQVIVAAPCSAIMCLSPTIIWFSFIGVASSKALRDGSVIACFRGTHFSVLSVAAALIVRRFW